ncbi:MAG: glycosyltransferase family A protein [Microcoleaceae cyanobacterium]
MNSLKKLSIVFAGRNDSYGGDFKAKVLAAWKRNYTQMLKRNIKAEWVFVEWNPLDKNYLSSILAPLGFKCYIIPLKIHQEICTNPQMNFMQFFAKNVGMRKASNDWIVLTNADVMFGEDILDFIATYKLDENLIYRAERRDIKPGLHDASFQTMVDNTVMYYDTQGGSDFIRGAGDFTLYNKRKITFGHDESIRDSDIYIDIRFLYNYKELSEFNDYSFIQFIGTVFKEDHHLTWRHTSHLPASHKGLNKREEYLHSNIPYSSPQSWGLANARTKQINHNIWQLESIESPAFPIAKHFRVVVLLTVRNEELYLERCLRHLHSQGVETYLIDNDSTDRTLSIAKGFLDRGVVKIEHFPFHGEFELQKICRNEERLAKEIDADWFIHHDADEIRQAPKPAQTLVEGIKIADSQGYSAINFDEFVFLPTNQTESFKEKDYVKEMQYYYFFEPMPQRRINAWKKNDVINLHNTGGHGAEFPERQVFPMPFILRHYIVLSRDHAIAKYGHRIYSKADLSLGWSLDRVNFTSEKLIFPDKSQLKKLDPSGTWDKSQPWTEHAFLLGKAGTTLASNERSRNCGTIQDQLAQSKRKLNQLEADLEALQHLSD